jgi:alpha-galactosidase/6-phospho-beta-glucosidase family protein
VDLARSEGVEAELNRLVEKRSSREIDPDEREELWQVSVRDYTVRRREEMRAVLEELIADHEEQAEKYLPKGA